MCIRDRPEPHVALASANPQPNCQPTSGESHSSCCLSCKDSLVKTVLLVRTIFHNFISYSRTNAEFCKFTSVRNADPPNDLCLTPRRDFGQFEADRRSVGDFNCK